MTRRVQVVAVGAFDGQDVILGSGWTEESARNEARLELASYADERTPEIVCHVLTDEEADRYFGGARVARNVLGLAHWPLVLAVLLFMLAGCGGIDGGGKPSSVDAATDERGESPTVDAGQQEENLPPTDAATLDAGADADAAPLGCWICAALWAPDCANPPPDAEQCNACGLHCVSGDP